MCVVGYATISCGKVQSERREVMGREFSEVEASEVACHWYNLLRNCELSIISLSRECSVLGWLECM